MSLSGETEGKFVKVFCFFFSKKKTSFLLVFALAA